MIYSTIVKGREKRWIVYFDSEEQARDMDEDGFDVIEIYNVVPAWAQRLGLTRIWCLAQNLWDLPSAIWRKIR